METTIQGDMLPNRGESHGKHEEHEIETRNYVADGGNLALFRVFEAL